MKRKAASTQSVLFVVVAMAVSGAAGTVVGQRAGSVDDSSPDRGGTPGGDRRQGDSAPRRERPVSGACAAYQYRCSAMTTDYAVCCNPGQSCRMMNDWSYCVVIDPVTGRELH